jgi:hypothetical protein
VTPRIALALVAAAVLGPPAAAAVDAGFPGTARQVTPTQGELGYQALTGSAPAARPTADKRRGFESGWQASYLKGTVAAPVQAVVLVYVYRTTADARLAYAHSCKGCREETVEGVRLKFQLRNPNAGNRTIVDVATCRNLYAAIVVGGKKTAQALGLEAGSIAGAIFRKAIARGMTPCASG